MRTQQVPISALGRIVTGDTPPKNCPEYYGSAYPFIKPTDMRIGERHTYQSEECYSEVGFEKYSKKLIPAGSTAVVTIGSIGQKLTLTHADCFINQAVNAIIPDKKKFDSQYVYYLMRHNLALVKSADTGASSGRENVSKSNFSSLEVVVNLDLDEQRRIGELLSQYDDLIETNRRRIALLEESARLLYREWFVDLRFPGHEFATGATGIPSGWQLTKLGDVVDAVGGATPASGRADYWNGEILWLTPTDLTKNDCIFLPDSTRKITEAGYASCSTTLLPPGTIFMTSRASIGYFAILNLSACTNQGFIAVTPKAGLGRNFFLFHLMSRVDEFRAKATGTTFKELSKKAFRELPLVMPSPEVLLAFETATRPTLDQVSVLKAQIVRLLSARDALLPQLMSGELRV